MRTCCLCTKKHQAKGYCTAHYAKHLTYGDPLYVKRKLIEYNGERKTKKAWAKELDISYAALSERLDRGWPVHLALTLPRQKQGGPRVRGVVAQYAQATG